MFRIELKKERGSWRWRRREEVGEKKELEYVEERRGHQEESGEGGREEEEESGGQC